MTNNLLLPKSNWSTLLNIIKQIAMGNSVGTVSKADQLFLNQMGYIHTDIQLTPRGAMIAKLLLVRRDAAAAFDLIHADVIKLPATQAILQELAGLQSVTISQVEAAIVMAGIDHKSAVFSVVNFLSVLNAVGIVVYSRKTGNVTILASSKTSSIPDHIYVESSRPYANDLRIREILRESRGGILWLDKYFSKEAFEWIWREADASKIDHINIVSTYDEKGMDNIALEDYKRLKKELSKKGIDVEWRTFDRKSAQNLHDRWLLDEEGLVYNVPSTNSIKSGQRSELHRSTNYKEIRVIFDEYYNQSTPIS